MMGPFTLPSLQANLEHQGISCFNPKPFKVFELFEDNVQLIKKNYLDIWV
jgi:hypothetical protein